MEYMGTALRPELPSAGAAGGLGVSTELWQQSLGRGFASRVLKFHDVAARKLCNLD